MPMNKVVPKGDNFITASFEYFSKLNDLRLFARDLALTDIKHYIGSRIPEGQSFTVYAMDYNLKSGKFSRVIVSEGLGSTIGAPQNGPVPISGLVAAYSVGAASSPSRAIKGKARLSESGVEVRGSEWTRLHLGGPASDFGVRLKEIANESESPVNDTPVNERPDLGKDSWSTDIDRDLTRQQKEFIDSNGQTRFA